MKNCDYLFVFFGETRGMCVMLHKNWLLTGITVQSPKWGTDTKILAQIINFVNLVKKVSHGGMALNRIECGSDLWC